MLKKENKSSDSFLSLPGAPARRALQDNGIDSLEKLAQYSEKEILRFHGLGKSSIPHLQKALKAEGLSFKK